MSLNKAAKLYPVETPKAVKSQLEQFVDKKVFTPVKASDMKGRNVKPFVSCTIMKQKYNADGTPSKLKARILADGRQEDRSVYAPDPLDTYAPTISITLLMLMLGIFAKENMHVSTRQ